MVEEQKHGKCRCKKGVTRRRFISSMGAGAVAVMASGHFPKVAEGADDTAPEEMIRLSLSVNGTRRRLLAEPRWSLLYVLREQLGLTGTKVGCDRGECGACTVLIDDLPRYGCMTLAKEAEGTEITTVEGLMRGETLGAVQQAFLDHDAFQCGYCTPGQIVAAEGLLRSNPSPSMAEIQRGMSGNLCRCGAYVHIFQAVRRSAAGRKGK